MNIILIYFAKKYDGDWDEIYKALENKEQVSLKDMTRIEDELKQSEEKITTILDSDYPKSLKEAYKPPFVFWTKGDKKLLDKPSVSLRADDSILTDKVQLNNAKVTLFEMKQAGQQLVLRTSNKGEFKLKQLAKEIGVPVIHMSAKGIVKDELKAQGEINEKGVFFTETPPGVKSTKIKQISTNRLEAAFADELVMISGKAETHDNLVSNFLNLGKEVNAFPSNEKSFNNDLIKQGANLVEPKEKFALAKAKILSVQNAEKAESLKKSKSKGLSK